MGAENFLKFPTTSNRKIDRARVLLAAKLQTPSGEIDARLRDISSRGALVECGQMPPAGTDVLFKRGSTRVPARVAWSGAGRVGLEFVYPIDETKLLVQLRKTEPRNGPGRWEAPSGKLNAKAMKLARAWGVTVGINLPEDEKWIFRPPVRPA